VSCSTTYPHPVSDIRYHRQSPHLVSFLYDRRMPQCKQCGLRISQEGGGQQKMDDHLDMHFMQNSRNDQNAGRGHSRSWFVGFEVSMKFNCLHAIRYIYL
jgi:hypothetical protein